MPCGWEGNRRSGVALAMHHRLQWFIHLCGLTAHGLTKGDEHPAYTPHGVWQGYEFLAAGPRLCNDLPPGLRRPGLTFDSFRQSLKTHLFGDLSVCLSVCVSVCLSICLSIYLWHSLLPAIKSNMC